MANEIDDRNDDDPVPPAADLRRQAERRLATQTSSPAEAAFTTETTERLVHELRVHQIELELQNDELRHTQEALESSRSRYFDLYDLAPIGYLTLNEAGLIEEGNLAAARLLDTPRDALIDQSLTRFILPEDQDIYYHCRRQLRSAGEQQSCELRLRRADAPPIWVRLETSLAPEAVSDQPPCRVILIDIDARKHSEQALIESQARLRLVADIGDLTFWEWDVRTNQVFFPPEWWRQTGYTLGELPLQLRDWAALLHPEDRARILVHLARFVEASAQGSEIQYRLRCKDGAHRWFMARLAAILDAQGRLARVLLVHQDVTHHKAAEDQAVHLAQHDSLTGLPSRALLDQLANHMLANTRRPGGQLAVLFFDLDRFKAVNDTYGHPVGDRLLQAVARRLRETFRAEDLVARLGGDEFIVVLANVGDGADVARAARNAIAALTPAYQIDGLELHCLASIGISMYPQDGQTIEVLIQRADAALYQAKQISPGSYQFVTAALNQQARTTATLEHRLREGLTRAAFQLAYQPILDTHGGGVTGVEALLRWPQVDGSEVAPLTLLAVAESSGLIHQLGQWVFEEVCRQQLAWRQDGLPPIAMAVNVSARQFHHQGFLRQLTAAAQASDVDPAVVSLELSEVTLMQDLPASRRMLEALQQLGVRVALDDFGLSYSSLDALDSLPLDRLAINRALVQRLGVKPAMPAMVDAIIGLGRALQLEIGAVGVETAANLAFLREHGCDQVQGFYLGVPMAGERFADWYRQQAGGVH
ncbi:GGDEF domain-containing protein [Thiocystis minor]|uniref:bifunctional diguanylate cyclase/phosphodiesterase n=1 Tax=Thiocystis minor TaxID=61597 RepID=UPI001911AF8A|nr:bifunctional diguanylate cyclase/phosphodiesterase [Thiocystis minor]MBK5966268.1 GGDEF domain-containing protein [Thiocystis minor]